MFNCGRNRYIYYPFWGGDRANYCGHPGYHLECRNDVTEIEIMSVKYQVLSFDQETRVLRITRTDFIDDPCPSNYIDSTLDPNLFKYTGRDTLNLTLLYGCLLPPLIASPIVTMVLEKYHFNCETSSGRNNAYFFRDPPSQEIMHLLMCRGRITVPITESAADKLESGESTLNDVLRDGFEVEHLANISYCAKCGNSGGECGYDWDLKGQTCFCYDSPRHQGWCPTKPPSSGSKNKIKIVIDPRRHCLYAYVKALRP